MNDKEKELVITHLIEKVSPFLIVLFGSTANGYTHRESDIDIAFLTDKKMDKYQLFMIAQELASVLNQDVDLIDLHAANTVFQAEIVHTGKVIYCTDEHKKALFEMKVLKMYAKLNEERAPILKRIEESGSVYEK
ncbi:type VII toxin-antitoxin system MntA family adenylyltransferase antitoxin [Bacillus alkalicellulosilyticus]|uniref:type VII toxin-antitoxin system MntA family adenylyltransferase antitoxin n=1 Tax=Alkalihalobacterium alkalicellulosilyticum TaxID=1912214 RepID=UPI000997FB9C|nr:nucleotidyltransferase domain-containing protein [Bacillus alkalicellulosilyticus]